MSAFVRTAWAFVALATIGFTAWFAVNNVDAVGALWSDLRQEPTRTWADVGAKLQEFMDQQPIDMTRPDPGAPAGPAPGP